MEKLQTSAKTGQEAHRQIEKDFVDNFGAQKEVSVVLNDGKKSEKTQECQMVHMLS